MTMSFIICVVKDTKFLALAEMSSSVSFICRCITLQKEGRFKVDIHFHFINFNNNIFLTKYRPSRNMQN